MKLSTKNLLIIFGLLIVVFAITQFTKRDNRSKSLRSELVNLDTAVVDKIVISKGFEEVTLSKEEKWKVSVGDQMKNTRSEAVSKLINNLNTIKPSRLAAKSKESWSEYQVTDSAATKVSVYDGSSVLLDILIGKLGVEGQQNFYTYVRLSEDDETYVANGFMGMSINASSSGYRENEVIRLKKDSLTSITFDYPDSAFVLTKSDKWLMNGQEADSASVASYIGGLSYTNSTKYYDEDIISTRTHQVRFSFSNQEDIIIDAYQVADGYLIRSSENAEETFKDSALDGKILKGPSAF